MIKERQIECEELYNELFKETQLGQSDWLENALCKNQDFKSLYFGNRIHQSESESDLALCSYLMKFSNNDKNKTESAFKNSPFFQSKDDKHKKKIERPDYIQNTIETAYCRIEKPVKHFQTITASDLLSKDLPELKWTVANLLPQGLSILASPPKFGKSWFALDLCNSVASGSNFLGYNTSKGLTLYLALEDSTNRLKNRLKTLSKSTSISDDFMITTHSESLETGLIDSLEKHIKENPQTSLIVIDTLQKIRGSHKKTETSYGYDYRELGKLKAFADKYAICILLVHHLRKMKDDDIFNQISGTNGIAGTCDTIMALGKNQRSDTDTILHITVRDVEHNEILLKFNTKLCKWGLIGTVEEESSKQEMAKYNNDYLVITIRKILEESPCGWCGSATEIKNKAIDLTGFSDTPAGIAKALKKLAKQLYDIDGILYTAPPTNGAGGKRIHKFKLINITDTSDTN